MNDPQLEPTFFDFFLKMQKIHILLLFKSFAKRVLLFALFVLRFLATSQVANAPETCNYSQSKLVFSIFSCMFLNPIFFLIWILIVQKWETSRKLKKHSVNWNFWKFSAFSLGFQKFFSITRTIFLTAGQNNFGNKIPFIVEFLYTYHAHS